MFLRVRLGDAHGPTGRFDKWWFVSKGKDCISDFKGPVDVRHFPTKLGGSDCLPVAGCIDIILALTTENRHFRDDVMQISNICKGSKGGKLRFVPLQVKTVDSKVSSVVLRRREVIAYNGSSDKRRIAGCNVLTSACTGESGREGSF